jgi:uncharacterized Fe-S center protein
MTMQQYPVCWECEKPIEYGAVFAAPCDHEDCMSACYHGICLMQWREKREEMHAQMMRWFRDHMQNSPKPEDN